MELELEVRYLRGVGPGRAALLARLGVRTVGDLLRYCPRRHEDRRSIAPLGQLAVGQATTFRGRRRLDRRGCSLQAVKQVAIPQIDLPFRSADA